MDLALRLALALGMLESLAGDGKMKRGDHSSPPTTGTIVSAPDIQTPSQVEYGLEGGFVFSPSGGDIRFGHS